MEKNVIFRKFEVIGTTKDEAKAQTTLNLRVDATQSYKKWAEKNAVTPEKQVEWMKQYLHDKKFDMPNDGAYIVIQSAVRDTRERPYQIEDIKHDAKTHSPEHFYVLRDENVEIMKEGGMILLLTAKPETIFQRVRYSKDRPILNGHMNVEYIAELMNKRNPRYTSVADIIIETDDKEIDQIVTEIEQALKK